MIFCDLIEKEYKAVVDRLQIQNTRSYRHFVYQSRQRFDKSDEKKRELEWIKKNRPSGFKHGNVPS